jgi:ribulose-phosphate 3-epimerase
VASALAADAAHLGPSIAALDLAGADGVQWDVMDGRFVMNLGFSADTVAIIRRYSKLPFEAHLMVEEPLQYVDAFVNAGCDLIIVHAEACTQLHHVLMRIVDLGVHAGVALNPATSITAVRHVLDLVQTVLVMTVNPGLSEQRYLPAMEAKMRELRALAETEGASIAIEVDGGINSLTSRRAVTAGADVLVAGRSVFGHPEGPAAAITELRG